MAAPDPVAEAASGYSLRKLSSLLGMTSGQIRSYVRSGVLEPRRGLRGELLFSFQDVVLLRSAKHLGARLPARRLKRALRLLQERLPEGRGLSGVQIREEGGALVISDGESQWQLDSGQMLLDFTSERATVRSLAPKLDLPVERTPGRILDAEELYQRAVELEPNDPAGAEKAYREAILRDPEHADALINLGRLLHENGDATSARWLYAQALRLRPDDATAWFNIGVAQEDLGEAEPALRAYERALGCDPDLADAHFNLARLHERAGNQLAALRHLKVYRKLLKPD